MRTGSLFPDAPGRMMETGKSSDCVVAHRWLKDSVWLGREPPFNLAVGRVFNFLARGMLSLPVMDTQCGARLLRAEVARRVNSTTAVTNRTFDVAMPYHAKRQDASTGEIGVRWKHDRETRMPIFRVIHIMLVTLPGIRVMNFPTRRYLPGSLAGCLARMNAWD